ncbi:MAG: hypothetical protein DWQ10_12140 [Calditrichaeota bacterium]|nr:MAG: hypothetical protein DWQ10_12140 [Calditrichota bacterium]
MSRVNEQQLIEKLLQSIQGVYGTDPFLIMAENGISVIVGTSDDFSYRSMRSFSRFLPENYTIEIDRNQLDLFWDEMYPGCPRDLKYRYAGWRELWQYWMYNRFTTVRSLLHNQFMLYIKTFTNQSAERQNYFAHYFAGTATGLIRTKVKNPTHRHIDMPIIF